jgi:hypothetical protein
MAFAAPRTDRDLLTRRQLLVKGAGGAAGLALVGGGLAGAVELLGGGSSELPSHSYVHSRAAARFFVSRPDLHPPDTEITGGDVAPEYLFLGTSAYGPVQAGPLILDGRGEPAWFKPATEKHWMTDVRVARYRGKPVLTWWEGDVTLSGFGQGEGVIMDTSYREIARVRAVGGRHIDMHEFLLTPEGTALFTCTPVKVPADLSSVGGPTNGTALEGIIQEVDVATGRLLFEWRSLEHVPISDSYFPYKEGYDYLHLNSIEITPDGSLLVSARHTWAVYKLERRTGNVMWRLGGKSSDFFQDNKLLFAWQHDARQPVPGTLTVFDDGAAQFANGFGQRNTESQSRGVALAVDERGRRVSIRQLYRHPKPLLSPAMGNLQTLPDGRVLLGWGDLGIASEFDADGRWLNDARFGNRHDSYRAYRYPWNGAPVDQPAVAVRALAGGPEGASRGSSASGSTRGSGASGTRGSSDTRRALYTTWNGATAVAAWLVERGGRPDEVRSVGTARRRGFETVIPLSGAAAGGGYARVTAVDVSGRRLGSSQVVRV